MSSPKSSLVQRFVAWEPTYLDARILLYALLWPCSAVLLGLSAEHLHTYSDLLDDPGSVEPIAAELLASSCLAVLWIPFAVVMLLRERRSALAMSYNKRFWTEFTGLFILFILYLVGSSYAVAHWPGAPWTEVTAFSWIVWGLSFSTGILTVIDKLSSNHASPGPAMSQRHYAPMA
ncbi:hypothetical protein CYLTODRAFT_426553 [Cylindrobasidium torrendii FP15055 ss-10]|uniref:MARVEL domain-containing protein n=1 Tax=Cylindrobasidium torrendii FP15055 ss-10 TaxID=1314674 RepID=A0A0D7AY44_9AGAR|nr:hypothetical protein CYLTODRAFT_426553 [Cylindrobasidium torrendii FP15055 ss-10]